MRKMETKRSLSLFSLKSESVKWGNNGTYLPGMCWGFRVDASQELSSVPGTGKVGLVNGWPHPWMVPKFRLQGTSPLRTPYRGPRPLYLLFAASSGPGAAGGAESSGRWEQPPRNWLCEGPLQLTRGREDANTNPSLLGGGVAGNKLARCRWDAEGMPTGVP